MMRWRWRLWLVRAHLKDQARRVVARQSEAFLADMWQGWRGICLLQRTKGSSDSEAGSGKLLKWLPQWKQTMSFRQPSNSPRKPEDDAYSSALRPGPSRLVPGKAMPTCSAPVWKALQARLTPLITKQLNLVMKSGSLTLPPGVVCQRVGPSP